jgi:hypothetical protein
VIVVRVIVVRVIVVRVKLDEESACARASRRLRWHEYDNHSARVDFS